MATAKITTQHAGWGITRFKSSVLDRIERMTIKFPGDGCWIWRGCARSGYGLVKLDNHKCVSAHKVVFEQLHGVRLRKGQMVMHMCDVRRCVRPDHLILGDAKLNAEDMLLKERISHVTGVAKARAIRRMWTQLGLPGRKRIHGRTNRIAREFGVSHGTVTDIVRGRTWDHV